MSATSIAGLLIEVAKPTTAAVAGLLSDAEQHWNQTNHRDIPVPEVLLEKAGKQWKESIPHAEKYFLAGVDLDPERANLTREFELRIARLTHQAWKEIVRGESARRPDPLRISCQALSNPAFPHTYDVVRFSIVLSLRTLYGVSYDVESLGLLRAAYEDLRFRFEQYKRRRQRKGTHAHENFLLDLLCLEGAVHRSLKHANLDAYLEGFAKYDFGVSPSGVREFAVDKQWPELHGGLPDFATVVNLAFTQPTAVPGLDDVTGGLLASLAEKNRGGGLVTMIAGPPGSGKTSLSLSITARMAELGSQVQYITTEESLANLEAKRTAIAEPSADLVWRDLLGPLTNLRENFRFVSGDKFTDFEHLARGLMNLGREVASPPTAPDELPLYLTFPRVIVVDSLSALLVLGSAREQRAIDPIDEHRKRRKTLANALAVIRSQGVCIFLTGGPEDADDLGLAFLVDNVFRIELEEQTSSRLLARILVIEKTRLQSSHRGRHVFHISRHMGCTVSPSLHSVLRDLHDHRRNAVERESRALLWAPERGSRLRPLALKAQSQVLLYGRGPAAKARLCLSLAFEPRVASEPREQWEAYVQARDADGRSLSTAELDAFVSSRVLVLSFLYDRKFYEGLAIDVLQRRFQKRTIRNELLRPHLEVIDFYPGSLDPESLVNRVRRSLRSARLEGRPFTAVIIDGIHNITMQFPLLEQDRLLWATLYRMLRTEGIDAISTFTFFQIAQLRPPGSEGRVDQIATVDPEAMPRSVPLPPHAVANIAVEREEGSYVRSSEQLFFHLLVSSCDYTFLVERPPGMECEHEDRIQIHVVTSIDGFKDSMRDLWWDPENLKYYATAAHRGPAVSPTDSPKRRT